MKMSLKACLAGVLLMSTCGLQAAELVVSKFEKGGVTFLSFDLVDAQAVHGMQFKVNVPGLADADLSKCTAGLGSDFNASCKVVDGVVTVTGFTADAKKALDGQRIAVGQISFRNLAKSEITVSSALTANALGEDADLGVSIQ